MQSGKKKEKQEKNTSQNQNTNEKNKKNHHYHHHEITFIIINTEQETNENKKNATNSSVTFPKRTRHLIEKGFQFKTWMQGSLLTNALILLVKIMRCSKLHCIKVLN